MKDRKNISGVYKEHVTSFLKHLKGAETPGEERVHKLRVDIKQLRSLYRFLEFVSKNKFHKKKIQKLISPVFDAAGEMRTTALNLKLTNDLRSKATSEFKFFLIKKLKGQKREFLKALRKFDLKKFNALDKKIHHRFKKENKQAIKISQEYIGSLYTEIRSELPKITSDESFHDIRKKLKDIKTISVLLEEITPGRKLRIQFKNVKSLEEKIGKWHDEVVFIKELEAFIADDISKYLNVAKKNKKNGQDNEKLSLLAIKLKAKNETRKKIIAGQLKKKLF